MRFLSIISCLPPHVIGGAESSAISLSNWLAKQGHDVAVVGMAEPGESVLKGDLAHNVRMWRLRWPRTHTKKGHPVASKLKKLMWHLQDHSDPRNRWLLKEVLECERPDVALVHVISGIGYNALDELRKLDLPVIIFTHDMNLLCGKSDMFAGGKQCQQQCIACVSISKVRYHFIQNMPKLAIFSPSEFMLNLHKKYLPMDNMYAASVLNVNSYPSPNISKTSSKTLRLLFVGRLHVSKGIDILLRAAEKASSSVDFTIVVAGTGPMETELRERYGKHKWCQFLGFVSGQEVSNLMCAADALCVPSIWRENSPGVIVNALQIGLPVAATARGGIPELVIHGKNGLLLETGCVDDWYQCITETLVNALLIKHLTSNAAEGASRFEEDRLGQNFLGELQSFLCANSEV